MLVAGQQLLGKVFVISGLGVRFFWGGRRVLMCESETRRVRRITSDRRGTGNVVGTHRQDRYSLRSAVYVCISHARGPRVVWLLMPRAIYEGSWFCGAHRHTHALVLDEDGTAQLTLPCKPNKRDVAGFIQRPLPPWK